MPENEKITEKDTLKLPKFKAIEVNGIVCYVDGTAELIKSGRTNNK